MSVPVGIRENYEELLIRAKSMAVIRSTASMMNWDSETYMPPLGIGIRSEQLALLDLMAHRELMDPKFIQLLSSIESDSNLESLSFPEKRNLQLLRRAYDETARIPEKLVTELARQQTLAVGSWKKAKAAKDFSLFKADLSKNIALKKELASILMTVKGLKTEYDTLIDIYEPGLTSGKISEIFAEMRRRLIRVKCKIEGSGTKPDLTILQRQVTIAAQKKISKALTDFIGFEIAGENAWWRRSSSGQVGRRPPGASRPAVIWARRAAAMAKCLLPAGPGSWVAAGASRIGLAPQSFALYHNGLHRDFGNVEEVSRGGGAPRPSPRGARLYGVFPG
jgi:hypothetical protein